MTSFSPAAGLRGCWGLVLVLLLSSFGSNLWGASVFSQINSASNSCKAIDESLKANKLTCLYLFEAESDGTPSWKKFENEEDGQKFFPKGSFKSAKAYFDGPQLVYVYYELKSPTKEWVQYLRYYFRPDGSLLRTNSDFRRFGAYEKEKGMEQEFLVKVLRDKYYSATGKNLKKSQARFFNMSTGQELRKVVFIDGPWPLFVKTQELPFYNLIKDEGSPETLKK